MAEVTKRRKKEPKLFFIKAAGKLVPVGNATEEAMAKIAYGSVVAVEIKTPKNIFLLRKFWALVDIVFDNQSRYKNRDNLADALKIEAGAYDMIELPGGYVYRIPNSIAEMEGPEFAQFFDRVCDAIGARYLPGVTNEWLRAEVERFIGIRS